MRSSQYYGLQQENNRACAHTGKGRGAPADQVGSPSNRCCSTRPVSVPCAPGSTSPSITPYAGEGNRSVETPTTCLTALIPRHEPDAALQPQSIVASSKRHCHTPERNCRKRGGWLGFLIRPSLSQVGGTAIRMAYGDRGA